jgi:hypothetical protein
MQPVGLLEHHDGLHLGSARELAAAPRSDPVPIDR